jgi:LDH2 family malate/lactate/ureidoglycolate dehydrogenase
MRVSLDELGGLTRRLFVKLDYPDEQTEIIVSILAYAHCRGNFQSLIQEVAFGTPRFQARREMVVEKETALSCMIDAGGNIGMCAMRLAIDLLAEKVKNIGLAIAGIRNSGPPGTGPVVSMQRDSRVKVSFPWCFVVQAKWWPPMAAVNGRLEAIQSPSLYPPAVSRSFWIWRPP